VQTKRNMKRTFAISTSLLFISGILSGCASGYQKFYQPATGATPETIAAMRSGPAPAIPLIEHGAPSNSQALLDSYSKRGYAPIGRSSFTTGRSESEEAAVHQAKDVGADLVLILDPKYAGSTTSNIPIVQPTSSTTYTTGTATAFSGGKTVTAYGNATSTTYGSNTTYIPIKVDYTNYGAVYFVKTRTRLGVLLRDLTNDERKARQTNKGVVIRLIVDNSPAFDADLLVGDIITSVENEAVTTVSNFQSLLAKYSGKSISMRLVRESTTLDKTVVLRN
jgi:hypothetical protein